MEAAVHIHHHKEAALIGRELLAHKVRVYLCLSLSLFFFIFVAANTTCSITRICCNFVTSSHHFNTALFYFVVPPNTDAGYYCLYARPARAV